MDGVEAGDNLMAEMLVRLVDKVNAGDPYKDAMCTKRGDVVTIQQDGWPWTTTERTNPEWKIVRVPGVDKELLSGYLAPDLGNPSKNLIPQRRAFRFDLVGVPLNDLTLQQALSRQITKPTKADPNVLGGP